MKIAVAVTVTEHATVAVAVTLHVAVTVLLVGLYFFATARNYEFIKVQAETRVSYLSPHVLFPKGPSIYDVHKKIPFFIAPPPVHMRPHGPDPPPPMWTSTRGRHEIHTALLKRLVQ